MGGQTNPGLPVSKRVPGDCPPFKKKRQRNYCLSHNFSQLFLMALVWDPRSPARCQLSDWRCAPLRWGKMRCMVAGSCDQRRGNRGAAEAECSRTWSLMTRLGCEADGFEWAAVQTRVEPRMSCVVRLREQLSVYARRRERPPGKLRVPPGQTHTVGALGGRETKKHKKTLASRDPNRDPASAINSDSGESGRLLRRYCSQGEKQRRWVWWWCCWWWREEKKWRVLPFLSSTDDSPNVIAASSRPVWGGGEEERLCCLIRI